MSLLRTVMDVHIQISDKSKHSNTVLLFVIRDYAGKTPKSNISSVLIEDLQKIWTSLKKSSELENKELTEIFSIQFEFLPHKILQSGEFKEAIQDFRSRFNNSLSENYIFTRILSDLVDKSDWIVFARNVWERILSNKDLDLPTERELLAQFRCDEISRVSIIHYTHDLIFTDCGTKF